MYISRKSLERFGETLGDVTSAKLGKGYICHGGGKGGGAPKTPDYVAAAQATAQGQIDAARAAAEANRVSQYTPYGNLVYSKDKGQFNQSAYDKAMQDYQRQLQAYNSGTTTTTGGQFNYDNGGLANIGRTTTIGGRGAMPVAPDRNQFYSGGDNSWRADVTLSPEQQALLDQQNKIGLGLSNAQNNALNYVNQNLSQPFDESKLPALPINAGQTVQDAIMSRLNPTFEMRQKQLDTQLANQGIAQGTEAYNNAQRQFGYDRNDAYINAALQGMNTGQSIQNQAFNQEMQKYNMPINTLSALRSGSPVQNPSFINPAQQATTQGADILGAQQAGFNAQLGNYNANQAAQNNFTSGLFGLGGSLLGSSLPGGSSVGGAIGSAIGRIFTSDERLKTNIKRIGTHDKLGVGIYSYEKFGKPEIGVMAQEVLKVKPDAVHMHDSGYLMVDYDKV